MKSPTRNTQAPTNGSNTFFGVDAPKRNDVYGDTSIVAANKMYKKYKKWFNEKYANDNTKRPMNFKEWLAWAQDRGLVKRNGGNSFTVDASEGSEQVGAVVKKTGKVVAGLVVTLAVLALMAGLVSQGEKHATA